MLYFIVTWTLLTIACNWIGTAVLNGLQADSFERARDRAIVAVWLGVVVLAISLLATSLVLPLSPWVGAVIITSMSSLSLLSQRTQTEIAGLRSRLSVRLVLAFVGIEVAIAALTTQKVTWYDTGLYHYGAIKWLSHYGSVPGIALLTSQLGFTSSWFALAAPFNGESLEARASVILNGFAFLIVVLHFLICLSHSFTSKAQVSDWFIVVSSLIIIPFTVGSKLMSVILASPSPDLPTIFLTEVVAWAILVISNSNPLFSGKIKHSILGARVIPLILSAGAVTMKLTALPLLLISTLFYLFGPGSRGKRVAIASAIILLLMSPMLISSTITSGCPLYPSSLLCFDLPWSVPAQTVQKIAATTHGWTTWFNPSGNGTNIFWLLGQWFRYSKLNKVMAALIAISILSILYVWQSVKTYQIRGYLWLIALGVAGMTFLMMTAPAFRFGLGYLILLPILPIAIYCRAKVGRVLPIVQKFRAAYYSSKLHRIQVLLLLFVVSLTLVSLTKQGMQERLLLPPQLSKVAVLEKKVNDVTYFSPPGKLCWASELPCTFRPQEGIKLRDAAHGLQAGFVRQN